MRARAVMGARVMIECGQRIRVGTAIEVDLKPPAPAKTRPWVEEVRSQGEDATGQAVPVAGNGEWQM